MRSIVHWRGQAAERKGTEVELLSGIRNLIRRRKPPLAIDIADPQPPSAVEEDVDVTEPVEVVEELGMRDPVALDVEPRSVPTVGSEVEGQGFDVAAAVQRICDRLDAQGPQLEAQADALRRLVQHMEQLSLVLKETAEIKGQCAQVIDLVNGQLSDARTRSEAAVEAVNETRRYEDAVLEAINEARGRTDEVIEAINSARGHDDAVIAAVNEAVDRALAAAVKRLGESSNRDAEVLDRIQRQVDANAEALRMAGETDEGVSQNVREVLASSINVQRAVAGLEKSHEGREAQITTHFAASKRTMITLAFACTLASLLALVVAVIALIT